MNLKINKIILEAQNLLITNPYDLAHDITHHYRVWEWTNKIVSAEHLKVNNEALTIAAWWHDLQDRKGLLTNKVEKSLKINGANKEFTDKVLGLIKNHSFGKKQILIEEKVLYDADKLEYVNPPRLKIFLKATEEGLISKNKYHIYKSNWNQRVFSIVSKLHYSYSRRKFKDLFVEAKELIISINKDFLLIE